MSQTHYIRLDEAARSMPLGRGGGRPPSYGSIIHWVSVGKWVGVDRVRLKAVKIGGCWMTTYPWVDEFVQKVVTFAESGELT